MEPIIALATPPLKSALALIRTSGDNIFTITSSIFSKNIINTSNREIFFGEIKNGSEVIDQVVLLVYPHPNSNTGEDVVEICCHGSMIIVDQIIQLYLSKGVRYATRGEFTSRAYLNGKMDLIEAEAVNDLINATTIEAKNLSLLSLKGETSSLFIPIKEKISYLLALLETNIDFPEYEDIREVNFEKVAVDCKDIKESIDELISQGEEGKLVKEGIKIAIVGEPNVGKSSLLNALLKEDKAIVSSIPGTTRDIVEGDINLAGIPLHILDTAGIRETKDEIEEIGVQRSEKSINESDLIILVMDPRDKDNDKNKEILSKTEGKRRIIVYNKSDLVSKKDEGIYISAINNDINALTKEIIKVLKISDSAFSKPSFNNARQLGLLRRISALMEEAISAVEEEITSDIIASILLSAYNCSRELLGEDPTLDLTDEIFSRFCVGK